MINNKEQLIAELSDVVVLCPQEDYFCLQGQVSSSPEPTTVSIHYGYTNKRNLKVYDVLVTRGKHRFRWDDYGGCTMLPEVKRQLVFLVECSKMGPKLLKVAKES